MNIIKALFQSTIGKKYVMAVTGLLLFGYVILHLLGNLQIYMGPNAINGYGALLHSRPALLWLARVILLAIFLTHVGTAIALTLENWAARPIAYTIGPSPYTTYASRTMFISGVILFCYIVYHVLHLTVGVVQPGIMDFKDQLGRPSIYRMLVAAFSNPWIALSYMVAMGFLYFHLSHGISSFFQSLGLKNRAYSGLILGFALGAALVIFLGFLSIPLTVLTGLVK
ncbi:MAG: succinate dehydrogenase cytochrome b subunit [Candidatus Omnitrophica bacterium]|nr:succinate dehydrogenase cytochrome b subunit [Candidatus Omnitrophota bacterium]